MPQWGGGNKCNVCDKTVYFAEQMVAAGKYYHKTCFKCSACKKSLDSTSCNEHEGELFCSGCYRKKYGPKGYGFASGGAGLSTDGATEGSANRASAIIGLENQGPVDPDPLNNCNACGTKVYFAEEIMVLGRKWHKACFKCSSCKKRLDSTSCNEHDEQLYCTGCYRKFFGPRGYGFASGGAGLSTDGGELASPTGNRGSVYNGGQMTGPVDEDPMQNCGRCGTKVYFAEELMALGRKWHKTCFKCADCHKTLDPGAVNDHDGELYCKGCHGKRFGTKGYGYGVGAGALQMS